MSAPEAAGIDAGLRRPEGAAPLPHHIVEEAVAWYVCLASGQQTPQDRADFERWLARDADHARAWQRLEGIGRQLRGTRRHIQPAHARSALARATQAEPTRRRALKALAWAGTGGTALYLARHELPWPGGLSAALADERTRAGERRSLVLADGTRLLLNTDTAVDIRIDAQERSLLLRGGEIQVTTAHDPLHRPFAVHTAQGSMAPLGTRFTVRRDAAVNRHGEPATRLSVAEGAVQVRPAGDPDAAVLVAAGRQLDFSRSGSGAAIAADDAAWAWTDGVLVAERRTLGDFVAELARYRSGRLRCAAEVAQLRITGTWPLAGGDPTERILASLERQLPVRIERITRYWVTVRAR